MEIIHGKYLGQCLAQNKCPGNVVSRQSICTKCLFGNEMWSGSGDRTPRACHKVCTQSGAHTYTLPPCPSGGRNPSDSVAHPKLGTWLWIRTDAFLFMNLWTFEPLPCSRLSQVSCLCSFCSSRVAEEPSRFLAQFPVTFRLSIQN